MKAIFFSLSFLFCCPALFATDVNPYPYPWPPHNDSSSSSSSSSSSVSEDFVGEFNLIAKGKDGSVALSNNLFYRPTHHHYRKELKTWRLRDRIRLLRTDDCKEFVLINMRSGKTVKTEILTYD